MSWSCSYIGTAAKITEALDKYSAVLTGMSKEEFDAALPHMKGVLGQNFNEKYPATLQFSASGHGYKDSVNGENRTCLMSVSALAGTLLT